MAPASRSRLSPPCSRDASHGRPHCSSYIRGVQQGLADNSFDTTITLVGTEGRGKTWWGVWNRRAATVVEFNGYERCFSDFESYRAFVAREAAFVRETLQLGPSDRVLDLGCGTGLLTSMVAPHVHSVIALDYSEHALEVARAEHNADNIDYRCADVNRLDLGNLEVDKAYSVGVLLYLDNYSIVRDLLRGLTRRGVEVLVVDVPDVAMQASVQRPYDVNEFSHLYFEENALRADFEGITVYRELFPEYGNDSFRFTFHLSPATA